jgi:hypothetical protein
LLATQAVSAAAQSPRQSAATWFSDTASDARTTTIEKNFILEVGRQWRWRWFLVVVVVGWRRK